jgi:hypothetical protein
MRTYIDGYEFGDDEFFEYNFLIQAITASRKFIYFPLNIKIFNPESAFMPNFGPFIDPPFSQK